jgi:hypothetical protein
MSKQTYWNHNGKFNALAKDLQDLIPSEGPVVNPRKNKKLEKYRKAVNCYYDLYNNGLCNRASQFTRVFGLRSSEYRYTRSYSYMECLYAEVEEVMDKIVYDAAIEQGLVAFVEI